MYTQIFAKNVVNDSTGKTSRVWSNVDSLEFSIDEEQSLLVVKASCYEDKGCSDCYDIERTFLLKLEKPEVEKLIATALNHKLLKKLDIANLAQIDKISALENKLEDAQEALKMCRSENRSLKAKILKAIALLKNIP